MKRKKLIQSVICVSLNSLVLILFVFSNLVWARSETQIFETTHHKVVVDVLADNLSHPWGLAFLPDGSPLITERSGGLKLFPRDGKPILIANVPAVWASGQGGLLDVAISPQFVQNKLIYLSYAEPSSDGRTAGTALAFGYLELSGKPRLEDVRVIFSQNKKTSSVLHFGSRIVITPYNRIFLTIGDRGDGRRAQDFFDYAGSIIRINLDGSVPEGNPYFSGKLSLPEIWSKGHRNAQGAVWNSSTRSIWTVSHGAQGGDEVNRSEPGKNYGWPVISYGQHYSGRKIGEGTHKEGMEQPVHYWDPSIAPSGLSFYQGDAFPLWKGDLFVGALKLQLIVRLEMKNNRVLREERLFKGKFGRIRDVRQGPGGYLYFLTDENPGQLLRVRPKL